MSKPIFDSLTDKLTIEALDWDHVPACEANRCKSAPTHAADYLAINENCGCERYMCSDVVSQVVAIADDRAWRCVQCGNLTPAGPWLNHNRLYPIINK